MLPLILLIASPCAAKSLIKRNILNIPTPSLIEKQQNKDRICSSQSYSETENVHLLHSQPTSLDNTYPHSIADNLAYHWLVSVAFDTDTHRYRVASTNLEKLPQPYYILYKQLLLYS